VVLDPTDPDLLAVDANDAGDDRQVRPARLHPWALLDMQFEEAIDLRQVPGGVVHPIDVDSGGLGGPRGWGRRSSRRARSASAVFKIFSYFTQKRLLQQYRHRPDMAQ